MNLQTWAKWVAEIDATGGAIVELRPGPYGGIKIGVRWMIGKEQYGVRSFHVDRGDGSDGRSGSRAFWSKSQMRCA